MSSLTLASWMGDSSEYQGLSPSLRFCFFNSLFSSLPPRCNTAVFSDAPSDWGDLLTMWGYMIHKLGADTTNHPILMTVPTLAPTALKREMYEVCLVVISFDTTYIVRMGKTLLMSLVSISLPVLKRDLYECLRAGCFAYSQ